MGGQGRGAVERWAWGCGYASAAPSLFFYVCRHGSGEGGLSINH